MIKFFRLFMNLLYGIFTMGVVAIIVWGANWLVNTGGKSYDVPNLVTNVEDDIDRTIYFSDIIKFDAVSIANAHKSHEIFLGNQDTGEEYILWRAVPVAWFNKSVTWSKNVLVAILSPSYEIEQMDRYRYALFVTNIPGSDKYITIESDEITLDNYTQVYGIVYGSKFDPLTVGTEFTKDEIKANGAWWTLKETDLYDFEFENEIIKFEKYNHEDYDQFEKFLVNKPVAKWAFAEIIIIFALTIFVVYQNPIDFSKNDRGVTEVDRGFLPRIPMPHKRERKHRHK